MYDSLVVSLDDKTIIRIEGTALILNLRPELTPYLHRCLQSYALVYKI